MHTTAAHDATSDLREPTIHVGLDIGTTKVCAVVASEDPVTGKIDIIGVGTAPCDGLKRGVVTNIGKTADAIRIAIEKAEQQSGSTIRSVVIGVAGDHISTFHTRAIVTTTSAEISATDIRRLHHELAQVRITPDRRILHVIPQEYVIDGQDGISDPLGMSGKRLEANALVITASSTAVENIYRCAERADLHVDALVLQPLASAYAVLDDAEKEVGVAIIDIGGGTTDVAVFKDNVLRYAAIVSIAGQKVTDDIVAVLGIRNIDAERIKVDHGHAASDSIMRDDVFQVQGVPGRTPTELSKSILCQISEPRVEEIFELAMQRLMDSGWSHHISAGVIVTGGSSMLRGSETVAGKLYRMPVNIGIPRGFSSDGLAKEVSAPKFATAVGLALYSVEHASEFEDTYDTPPLASASPKQQSATQPRTPPVTASSTEQPAPKEPLLARVKNWFENF